MLDVPEIRIAPASIVSLGQGLLRAGPVSRVRLARRTPPCSMEWSGELLRAGDRSGRLIGTGGAEIGWDDRCEASEDGSIGWC